MSGHPAGWTALYSGGKDSYLALDEAERSGRRVNRLLTVDAPPGSYLYHAPTTDATDLAARSMGRDHVRLDLDVVDERTTSHEAAETEIEPLERWLADAVRSAAPPAGLVSGVMASRYQYDLLGSLCDRYGVEFYAPLWDRPAEWILEQVRERDLTVDVVAVAANGLDRSWLGRRLTDAAIAELVQVAERHDIHRAGEGGEFETIVVDAPRFDRPIRYRAGTEWEGTHGHLRIESARLVDRGAVHPEG